MYEPQKYYDILCCISKIANDNAGYLEKYSSLHGNTEDIPYKEEREFSFESTISFDEDKARQSFLEDLPKKILPFKAYLNEGRVENICDVGNDIQLSIKFYDGPYDDLNQYFRRDL